MDIFEYALQMERDGENFYRKIAEKTDNTGLKTIVTMLADEEVKHYQAIEKMKQGPYEMAETNILDDAKNIFVQMKETSEEFDSDLEQTELYKKAQEIEKQSQRFYLSKAGQLKNENQKRLFKQLAEEEEKHYFLLENIIDLVSRPQQWLENAEWYHLEEY